MFKREFIRNISDLDNLKLLPIPLQRILIDGEFLEYKLMDGKMYILGFGSESHKKRFENYKHCLNGCE